MHRSTRSAWTLLTLPVVLGISAATAAAQDMAPAHTHIRHVAETFRGTPERMGLLPTAIAEAEIALQHATLAGRDPSSLDAMQRHAGHVLHALQPDGAESGPGRGYGMIDAAERAAHYVELAMLSDGAGEATGTHGPHVVTAARSAASMAQRAVEVAEAIVKAEDAETAAGLLEELTSVCDGMLNGVDADGDGRIGWQEGEGGLAQAAQHLDFLRRGEGLVS
jgi:hypothetical protein